MKWTFAENGGGRESGFHDAGVETFKGNFDRYLARELIQNSLDARLDANKPVQVSFTIVKVSRSKIPDMASLRRAFDSSREYWSHDAKASAFFEAANSLASAKEIDILCISDENTTGVLGSDTDRTENWYNLVKSAGSSSKLSGEGGSFGIGKNAPFAASKMRTVFYSTFNKKREYVFQGVAMLVSHKNTDGKVVQPVGYLGGKNGSSVRRKKDIPIEFTRKKFGTDIRILGFDKHPDWQSDLVYSVLDNFWPAIEFGDLQVTVGTVKIDANSLERLLQEYSAKDGFTAHLYYSALKGNDKQSSTAVLPNLGAVELHLIAGEPEYPKKIVMVRKTGMKIFEKSFRGITPFCGVFLCRNDVGNQKLREMEPPRHDTWDPDNPEKGVNKKVELEYVGFIRECVKKLTISDNSTIISIPDLNRYLPDDDESVEERFDASSDVATTESYNRRTLPTSITGKPVNSRKLPFQPDNTDFGDKDDTEFPGDDDPNTNKQASGRVRESSNSSKKPGAKSDSDRPEEKKGRKGGRGSKPSLPISYRTFSTNTRMGTITAYVKPIQGTLSQVALAFWAIGDDRKEQISIKSAQTMNGQSLNISNENLVGPLEIPQEGMRLEIILNKPGRISMEIAAYETE